jgi:hypothetical protein
MKKLMAVLLAVAVVLAGCGGVSQSEFDRLQRELEELQEQVGENKNDSQEETTLEMSYTNEISLKSLKAVQASAIPPRYSFTAIEIFVKRNTDITECIVFGVLSAAANDYTQTYYRLIINNNDHSDTRLFMPFDQVLYDTLIAGDNKGDRLNAATMMNFYETFLLSVDEINSGNTRWERADIEFVNYQFTLEIPQ